MTPRLLFHPSQQLTTLRWLSLVPGTPKNHVKMKESVRRTAKKHNDAFYLENFRMLIKESKAALVNRLKLKLKEYHTSLGDSLQVNPKRFFNYFRHKTKSNSIPAHVTYGGRQISTGEEMAEAFILRLRMRLMSPLMRLRHPTRGCPSLTASVRR